MYTFTVIYNSYVVPAKLHYPVYAVINDIIQYNNKQIIIIVIIN